MDKVLGPTLRALLPRVLGPAHGAALAEAYLRSLTTVWLLPAYLISLVVSMLFYAELAELAVVAEQRQVLRRHAEKRNEPLQPVEAPIKVGVWGGEGWWLEPQVPCRPPGSDGASPGATISTMHSACSSRQLQQAGALDSASETLYRTLLLAGVFAVVWALEWIPAVGAQRGVFGKDQELKWFVEVSQIFSLDSEHLPLTSTHTAGSLAAGLLLAWTYALYCFDYKWEAHGVPLSARIAFLETHWGYFLGVQAVAGVSNMEIVR